VSTNGHYLDSEQNSLALLRECYVLSGEAVDANFIVFGLTRPGLELTIYCTRGEHANQYATDVVIAHFEMQIL
jgi:hypothetical protein